MKPVTALTCLLMIGLSAALADTGVENADDQVIASFEREFNHEPTAAKPAERADIDADVLYELVNKPLQASAAASEELVASNTGGES